MKKFLFGIIILLIPFAAKAQCTAEQISRLKVLATYINTTYDYVEQDNYVNFDVTLHNISNDLVIKNPFNGGNYNTANGEVTIKNMNPSKIISVSILSNLNDCKNEIISTKYITTPKFNKYYSDPLCKGNETKTICQKWTDTSSMNYETFKSKFEKDIPNNSVVEQKEKTFFDKLSDLFIKYYYVLFSFIIVTCLLIIILKNRKDKFNF